MKKSKFKNAQKDMLKKREVTAKVIGLFVEGETKRRTPVKTGHLRRGITHEIDHVETKSTVVVGSNVEYDAVIELGSVSRNITAQPHYRPAVSENLDRLKKMVHDGVKIK